MRGWSHFLLAGVLVTQHGLTIRPAVASPKKKSHKRVITTDDTHETHVSIRQAVRFERRKWRQARSPIGDRFAQVKTENGGERVLVDGELLYPREGATRVVSNLTWSRDGKGLAFVERTHTGSLRLVVFPLLDLGEPLTWDIPDGVLTKQPYATWIAPCQVGVGESEAVPQMIARFSVEQHPRTQ